MTIEQDHENRGYVFGEHSWIAGYKEEPKKEFRVTLKTKNRKQEQEHEQSKG